MDRDVEIYDGVSGLRHVDTRAWIVRAANALTCSKGLPIIIMAGARGADMETPDEAGRA